MKLLPVDLCNYDFDKFISNIDESKTYLVKYNDKWMSGRWAASRVNIHGPGSLSWDFISIFNFSGHPNNDKKLTSSIQEMYEIYDEDLIVKQAKKFY